MGKDDLLRKYSLGTMSRFCKDRGECVMGKAPRLSEVANQEGENNVLWWVTEFLASLANDTVKCKEMPTAAQYDEMASMIFGKYNHLKLTEIMLFFYDCKSAVYDFYGRVDTLAVMSALKSFVEVERPRIIRDWDERQKKLMEQETKEETKVVGNRAKAMVYARKMLRNDWEGGLGPAARKIWEMIAKGDFRGKLGNYAKNIDYYFRDGLVKYFADKIMRNDYVGRRGLMAEKISGMIETGDFTDDALGYVGRKVGDYLKAIPRRPLPAEPWEEIDGRDEDDIIKDYADRMTREDFSGKTGANAQRAWEMLGTGNFTDDWLGGIAKKVGEYLAESFAPTYAKYITKKDSTRKIVGNAKEIAERAKEIAERIENNDISEHWWLGEVERKTRDYLRAHPSGTHDGTRDDNDGHSQLFDVRPDAPF